MKSLHDEYIELVKQTAQYIAQEHKRTDWIYSGTETYGYFRDYVRQQKAASAVIPATVAKPVVTPPPSFKPPSSSPIIPKLPLPSEPRVSIQEAPKDVQTKSSEVVVHEQPKDKRLPMESKPLTLDPLPQPKPEDLSELYQYIQEKFPAVQLLKNIPSDEKAHQLNKESLVIHPLPQVILLTYQNDEPTRTFLENIAQAIRGLGFPSSLIAASSIEQAQEWEEFLRKENLKLIISNHHGLHSLPALTKHLKETDRQGKQYLGKIPLCFLADVSVYQKDPKLKVPLWQSIKTLLGK
jgi:hypothetical protein